MKRISVFILTLAAAAFFAACGGTTENKPVANNANATNANAAKPDAAAPTKEILLAVDKQANEAFLRGDGKFFEGFLDDKFVMLEGGQRMDKAAVVKMIGSGKCDVKDWKLEEPQMAMIDADTAVLTYKGTFDGTCSGPDGKAMKLPSPVRAASVYIRSGDKWMPVFHGENLIVDPKNPPAPPAKHEARKEEQNKDDKAAVNSNTGTAAAPAKATPDAKTDALVKIHLSGWEAFKAKDAKKFEEITTKDVSFVDPMGMWTSGQANVIKVWTDVACKDITKVSVSDGFASAISPTAEILTVKGTSDGTCYGQKNGDLYQTAVYVKEGDAWKLAFMFESPAM